jgi:hypothetical protein
LVCSSRLAESWLLLRFERRGLSVWMTLVVEVSSVVPLLV